MIRKTQRHQPQNAVKVTEGVLRLYGIVGDWDDGFTDDDVADQFDEHDDISTVRINSPGGYVYQGMAIYNLIKERQPVIKIDGLAASMGSVIACAGSRVVMGAGSMMMIHNPWNIALGDSNDLRKTADVLDKIGESILDIYQARTGQPRDLLAEMMDEETWLTADEAVEWGFADAVDEESEPADFAALDLFPLSNCKNMPEQLQRSEEHTSELQSRGHLVCRL